jgi:hypothetical protein
MANAANSNQFDTRHHLQAVRRRLNGPDRIRTCDLILIRDAL